MTTLGVIFVLSSVLIRKASVIREHLQSNYFNWWQYNIPMKDWLSLVDPIKWLITLSLPSECCTTSMLRHPRHPKALSVPSLGMRGNTKPPDRFTRFLVERACLGREKITGLQRVYARSFLMLTAHPSKIRLIYWVRPSWHHFAVQLKEKKK